MPGEPITWDDGAGRRYVEVSPNPGAVVLGANRFYRRPPECSVPAFQVTRSSLDGNFPWEKGHPGGAEGQPRPGTWQA